ncbi:MAG: 16S rRNA (cytidine(1402)-2'-O)-methyltransferase [Gammaproteobacteria bacterium]
MSNKTGILYVVATPIGNLDDISSRACRILDEVDLILAEDTRRSRKLLNHLGIVTPMKSYHDFNERKSSPVLLERLIKGENLALISDAGTPLICDPGYQLVKTGQEQGIRIVPIPGPSALVSALSVAGLPTDRFVFEGFAPEKPMARKKYLANCTTEIRTMIFYEAPQRILYFFNDAVDAFGAGRVATLARELTKKYESIHKDTLANLSAKLAGNEIPQKGEFVIVIHGAAVETPEALQSVRLLRLLLGHSLPVKEAVAIAADFSGARKNDLYKIALTLRDET